MQGKLLTLIVYGWTHCVHCCFFFRNLIGTLLSDLKGELSCFLFMLTKALRNFDDVIVASKAKDRIAYVLCIEGAMDVTGAHATAERLVQHDAANISGPNKLTFTASQGGVHFILISMSAG